MHTWKTLLFSLAGGLEAENFGLGTVMGARQQLMHLCICLHTTGLIKMEVHNADQHHVASHHNLLDSLATEGTGKVACKAFELIPQE